MRKRILISMILVLSLLSTGCYSDRSGGKQSFDGIQLAENAEIVSEYRMENVIKKGSEKLLRFYDEELYAYQEDPVVGELNELYSAYIVELIDPSLEEKLVTEIEILFYGDSIRDYKENKLTFSEIVNNPGTHIKQASIQLHMFRGAPRFKIGFKKSLKEIYKPLEELWGRYRAEEVDYINILWSVYDEEVLSKMTLEELEKEESKILYMDVYKSCLARFVLDETGFDSYKSGILSNQDDLDYLAEKTERKYDESFVGIINAGKRGKSYAAPTRDMSLAFELNGTDKDEYERIDSSEDRYIALVMYKYVYSEIERILEKYELTETVIPILVTKDGNLDIINLEVKVDEIDDWPLFMEENFPGEFEVTLNILDKRVNCDETMLFSVIKEIQYILGKDYFDRYSDMDVMVYFYGDMTKEGKKLAIDIYRKSPRITNKNFEEGISLVTVFDGIYTNYSYEEWFKYLSAYFTRQDGHIVFTILIDELEPETFLDEYKSDELL